MFCGTKTLHQCWVPCPKTLWTFWHYGFYRDAEQCERSLCGTLILVRISKTAINTEMMISDNGIGIFKKIQEAFNLPDQRYAILGASKR